MYCFVPKQTGDSKQQEARGDQQYGQRDRSRESCRNSFRGIFETNNPNEPHNRSHEPDDGKHKSQESDTR